MFLTTAIYIQLTMGGCQPSQQLWDAVPQFPLRSPSFHAIPAPETHVLIDLEYKTPLKRCSIPADESLT